MSGSEPFRRVLCAVAEGEESDEAVRQGGVLAGPWSRTKIVAVVGWGEPPLGESLTYSEAEAALDRARALGNGALARAHGEVVRGDDPAASLADELERDDLLVIGSHGGSRARGAILGTVPAEVMHRPPCPVLVARRPPEGERLPERILVASDGSPASRRAAEVAGGIARRAGSELTVLHVDGSDGSAEHRELALEVVAILEATGVEPAVVTREGRAHREIIDFARQERCSLVVVGSRGLGGARALGSVSERVGHEAEASVLVVPPAG